MAKKEVIGEVVICSYSGAEVLRIRVDDDSYRIKTIMGDNKLFLNFSTNEPIHIPVYSNCTFKNEVYTLMEEKKFTKEHTENHAYRLEMEAFEGYLKTQTFEYMDIIRQDETIMKMGSSDVEFSLIAKPEIFVQLLVDNMNMKDAQGGWHVGSVIHAPEMLLDFNNMKCYNVLSMLASKFKTEWQVVGKTINLGKVERRVSNPLPLAYGHKKGLLPGIERTNYKGRIGRLKLKSSDRNIDKSTYGTATLRMPRNKSVSYGGVNYVTDDSGTKLSRRNPVISGPIVPEDTLDLTEIYPKYVGTVSEVIEIDDKKSLYEFIDGGLGIDFSEHVIAGEQMTIIFQNGQLAGLEFDVEYIHEDLRFRIIPISNKGLNYPQGTLIPKVGDKYAVFHISLPDGYIESAEDEVLQRMAEYLHENEEPQYSYRVRLNPLYAKALWEESKQYLDVGMMIRFSEPQYLISPVDIRITSIREYLHQPYSPEITLSNAISAKTIGDIIEEIPNKDQTIDRKDDDLKNFTKRRWRDALEMLDMLDKAVKGYTEGITPAWIRTLALLVGDETLQFRFVKSKENPEKIDSGIVYDNEKKRLTAPPAVIQHMTLGVKDISPSHSTKEYRFWTIPDALDYSLDGNAKAQYVYAKCEKASERASFIVSDDFFDFDNKDGHYYLLIGILSSEYEGYRSYKEVYGFTEISGGSITTERIVDVDGYQYWDMLRKAFRIGDENNSLSYNIDGMKQLILKGTLVQSPSGDKDYIEVDRGDFVRGAVYYPGDKVKYLGNIYKCIYKTTGTQDPSNAGYWKLLVSKGEDGDPGKDAAERLYAYWPSDSVNAPVKPSRTNGTIPSGWMSYPSAGGKKYVYMTYSDLKDAVWSDWSTPVRFMDNGKPGVDGKGYSMAYFASNSVAPPSKPVKTTDGSVPSGWLASPDFNGMRYVYMTQAIYENGVWGDWSLPKLFAMIPEKGDPGPGIVFRGEFNEIPMPRIFYNNGARRDVVYHSDTYWIWNGKDTERHDSFDPAQWESFGGQFESIATKLLLAENANLGGWMFKNGRLESQDGTAFLDGRTGQVKITGSFESNKTGNKIVIDPEDKSLKMISDTGLELFKIYFKDIEDITGSFLSLTRYYNGRVMNTAEMNPIQLIMRSYSGTESSSMLSANTFSLGAGLTDFSVSAINNVLRLVLSGLPTSGVNLPRGTVWRDGNLLRIAT